ncbi:MAG: sensor histidine kinase [Caulobacteraceae bacterium]
MFEHISFRPTQEVSEASISTEVQMAQKGMRGRLAFATVGGLSSLLWLPLAGAAAYIGAIWLWELALRPWTTHRAVALLKERGNALRLYHRCVILLIACLYSAVPLSGILSGERVGWFVAIMAFCTAVISGITYFSNDKWQFSACIAPSFVIACAAPFVFGVPAPVAVVILLLNAMFAMSALQSAAHRGELVESVAKQQAARSRAESANVEKSQFIANVSHELRSPLNAIIGYSEMLREAAEEDARASDQADLDKVLTASRRLLHLVNELLDISKVEAGKLALNVTWFDAEEMIDGAVASTRPLVQAAGKVVVIEPTSPLGQGLSDEFRLGQCVTNLLSSALLGAKGDVMLRARRVSQHGEWFDIEVIATGARLDDAALERLFDPFAEADEAHRGSASLGLAITRRIARLLGGDVTAEARPDGAVFRLRTPVIARVSTSHDAARAAPETGAAHAA